MSVRENLFVAEAIDDVCACSIAALVRSRKTREVGLIDVRAEKRYFRK